MYLHVSLCLRLHVFTSQLNHFAVSGTLSQFINFICCRINKCGLHLKTFLKVFRSLPKLTQLEALRCQICVQLAKILVVVVKLHNEYM